MIVLKFNIFLSSNTTTFKGKTNQKAHESNSIFKTKEKENCIVLRNAEYETGSSTMKLAPFEIRHCTFIKRD